MIDFYIVLFATDGECVVIGTANDSAVLSFDIAGAISDFPLGSSCQSNQFLSAQKC